MSRGKAKSPRSGSCAVGSAWTGETTGSAGAMGDAVSAAGGVGAEKCRSDGGGYFSKKLISRGGSDWAVRRCRCKLIVCVVANASELPMLAPMGAEEIRDHVLASALGPLKLARRA